MKKLLVVGKPSSHHIALIETLIESGYEVIQQEPSDKISGYEIDYTVYDELHCVEQNYDVAWYRKFEKRRKV